MPNYYPLPKPTDIPLWQVEAIGYATYLEAKAKRARDQQEIAKRKAWNASMKPYLRPERGCLRPARSWIAEQIERNLQLIAILSD